MRRWKFGNCCAHHDAMAQSTWHKQSKRTNGKRKKNGACRNTQHARDNGVDTIYKDLDGIMKIMEQTVIIETVICTGTDLYWFLRHK